MAQRVAAVLVDPATGAPYTAVPVNIGSTVNRTASGNITSTQPVALSTAACGSAAFQVSGTWAGTLDFEYTIDDLTWHALSVTPDSGGAAVSSTTANGNWFVQVESYSQVRVVGNTVGSGTAAVFLSASTSTSVVSVASPLPVGDNAIGRVKITDGTDVAAVTAAGALSVDASATTALPLPTGAATAAAQATGNASLSSIDGKTPALGQAAAAGSTPVVLATDQVGAAGSPSTAVLSVQGVSGGTGLPIALSGATAGAPVGVTVSTSAVLIIASNTAAKNRLITNSGLTNVYLGGSSAVTASGATLGILLRPGGSYADSGPSIYTGDIYGIGDAVAASQNVSAWERT